MENESRPLTLARAVSCEADVASLAEADRLLLARWLAQSAPSADLPPGMGRRRRRVLVVATAAAVFLVPWVALLAVTLPQHQQTHLWRTTWVGFDIALLLGFASMAWLGWRNRQLVMTAMVVTATLMLCDAWFDLTLSWGGREQAASILTAAFGEVPFAVFLFVAYRRMLLALARRVWEIEGEPGPLPALWRQRIFILPPRPKRLRSRGTPPPRDAA